MDASSPSRARWLFETAYGRLPGDAELRACADSLSDLRTLHAQAGSERRHIVALDVLHARGQIGASLPARRNLDVLQRTAGAFERTLVTGVAMLVGIPFWLAALGGIRLIPLTGVATAFAAHGGAKLLATSLAVGLAAGVSHRRAREDIMDEALAPPPAEPQAKGIRIV